MLSIFLKKLELGYVLGDFFTNSTGRPDRNIDIASANFILFWGKNGPILPTSLQNVELRNQHLPNVF
jgi:hypothetical protein